MKKILLAGYYGFGNLGDEAILEMSIKQILQITNKENITVLTSNVDETQRKYNIKAIDRNNIFSIINNLRKSYMLVFGGGSLLQDVTSKRSIYYYLWLIKLAKIMNNKVIMLSQGIGPIINERNKKMTSKILNTVDCITVRDKESGIFLEDIGVNKKLIFLSADPVINLNKDNQSYEEKKIYDKVVNDYYKTGLDENLKKINENDKSNSVKKVCFSLRNWKNSNVSSKISDVVLMLIEKGIECHFIPFYYKEDMELILDIEKKIGNKAYYYKDKLSTDKAYDIIKNMDVLVGVRLHSLIFAASSNVPFVAVSYDHKVDHFSKSVNMEVVCKIEEIDSILLFESIMRILENEKMKKEILANKVKVLRELFSVNYNILKKYN